ncbi:MAG: DUF58 domain-containing protein [Bacteroidetes Order II. Incertae sedis bacterium]|nr:DUF58 domain-containing protein [Bacteroidetes Order II. bacterium]
MNAFRDTFFTNRLYLVLGVVVVVLMLGHFTLALAILGRVALILVLGLVLLESLVLYLNPRPVSGERELPERFSNGDANTIGLVIRNGYAFRVHLEVIDEVPFQFQERYFNNRFSLAAAEEKAWSYTLRPVRRGVYHFGILNVLATTRLGLVQRRFRLAKEENVAVYPSFLQMRQFELYAISNRLTEAGVKRIRRIGRATNFEQIRAYVPGDEPKTVNWRATARRADLMVNQYEEEKAQQVFSVLDLGRNMEMPFEGMSLLDYAINATLVISNIAMLKQDKAGLVCFSDEKPLILPADRKKIHLQRIMDALYRLTTDFKESDFEKLYAYARQHIHQRSLLLLYTNFESLSGMKRRLRQLQLLAKQHLVVVIFFENTELSALTEALHQNVEHIYIQTIAEKVGFEKREVVRELKQYGIHTILTSPQNLTVSTINKYLELKARGLI